VRQVGVPRWSCVTRRRFRRDASTPTISKAWRSGEERGGATRSGAGDACTLTPPLPAGERKFFNAGMAHPPSAPSPRRPRRRRRSVLVVLDRPPGWIALVTSGRRAPPHARRNGKTRHDASTRAHCAVFRLSGGSAQLGGFQHCFAPRRRRGCLAGHDAAVMPSFTSTWAFALTCLTIAKASINVSQSATLGARLGAVLTSLRRPGRYGVCHQIAACEALQTGIRARVGSAARR